jgi:hypothetical protein
VKIKRELIGYYIVDYRADGRVDYVKSFPESRNGRWVGDVEMTRDPNERLLVQSARTAARLANMGCSTRTFRAVYGPPTPAELTGSDTCPTPEEVEEYTRMNNDAYDARYDELRV